MRQGSAPQRLSRDLGRVFRQAGRSHSDRAPRRPRRTEVVLMSRLRSLDARPLELQTMAHEQRRCIEAAVEALIALLDTLDGDPDLEDGADAEDGHDAEQHDPGDFVPIYADDGHGGEDQRRLMSSWGP